MPPARVCLLFVTVLCLAGWSVVMSRPNTSSSSPRNPAGPPQPSAELQQQRILWTRTQLRHVESMLLFFAALDNDDQFPVANGQHLLETLTKKHDLQGDGYFADPVFEDPDAHKDAWSNRFHYEWPNTKVKTATKPAIWSYGPNGIDENGAGDDVRNW